MKGLTLASVIAQNTLIRLLNSPLENEIQILLIRWANGELSRDNYFVLQEELLEVIPKGEEYDWGKLKKENLSIYSHELAHKQVLDDYGIQSKLYKVSDICYYTEDINLKEIAISRGYSAEEVRKIQAEMIFAPFKKEKILTSYLHTPDIIQYETLIGTIKKIHISDFTNAFSKYEWKE